MSNAETQRLRNYPSQFEEHIQCTIWQAARATSAAPTFFDPITFTNGVTFCDGALRDNNPISALIHEVDTEFPSRQISAIVSLGTGVAASISIGKGLASIAKACVKISTDSEKKAEDFLESYCNENGRFRNKYFRFNVSRGLQDVGLEEWQKHDIMWSNTLSYLGKPEQRAKLSSCAQQLRLNSPVIL